MKIRVLPFVFALAALAACDNDPFRIHWEEDPRESTLFALDREELNRPSAFNLRNRAPVVVESVGSQGRWDFALDRMEGELFLLPPRALGVPSEAGIVPIPDVDWDELLEAPADTTLYNSPDPVLLEVGTVYAVRTHRQPDGFGRSCLFYGKIQALEVNRPEGLLRFRHDRNPECGNRRLVPAN